ncbi:pyridoxamine 5'-phosphate oxidase family protein [Aquamicrobium zhengzhouense]|uniref:Pyridoxamine 5'-phosphate oxidase family protein n=1 Tax=Aquamicrobium zhengzhouense TaxID=2781738 RepID=A0ABS0SFJ8_9HYPH|nr:pyridoxamine 5'-phosphate oxidase family protein [Aquamicrobium zhengzhouense]MBI1622077.1 pyridoxamine 5'-phosphate oxidase family protein [Aquamicrobium zhengzhouense]
MEFITTRDELRTHYKQASGRAVAKEMRALDRHARTFLAHSPFVLIGSQDAAGNADVTPKGDRPGFVAVLDDATIAIPDRPGNNRLDTFENLIENPAIGLIFLIPGMNETLRINGKARLTADLALRERFAIDGKLPISVLVVSVDACYMHCAKAFMRSSLWKPETWPDRASLPTLGQILAEQIATNQSGEEVDEALRTSYAQTMW